MNSQFWSHCNLRWQELLSSDDIRAWTQEQKMPIHLRGRLLCPGIYRFVFREFRDENGKHTPCYVGEAGRLGRRLSDHFRRDDKVRRERTGKLKLKAGWGVRGAIQRSGGEFKLQALTIEGPVNFNGLVFGPDTIPGPFEDSFVRKLLENLAIVVSEYVDGLRPTNRRGTPHVFKDILKQARKRSRDKSKNAT
jgi:hypothetical protein